MSFLRDLRARLLRAGRESAEAVLQRVPERPRNAFLAGVAALMPSPYHAGELAVQRRAGTRAQGARSGLGVGAELPSKAAALLARQGFVLLSARDAEGRPWVTALEGAPGFLHAPDALTLTIAARPAADDPLLEALAQPTEVALLAIDFASKERLRIEGPCEPDAASGLRIQVRSALVNCPQYVRRRQLERVEAQPGPVRAGAALDEGARSMLAAANVLFIGSTHPERGLDVSHKAGAPGFLRVDDERRLTLPDYVGNGMFQTLGNVSVDERVGLLVPDFADGTWVQLTGRARIDWDEAARESFRGAQRLTRIAIDRVVVRPGRGRWRLAPESDA